MIDKQIVVIQSEAYGTIEASHEQIYHFPQGLVGLSNIQTYALLPFADTELFILHAIESQLSFVLVPAHRIADHYAFQIEDHIAEILQSETNEIIPLLIVNIVDQQPFVNLKAPILLATTSQKGFQYILNQMEYPIRTPLRLREAD